MDIFLLDNRLCSILHVLILLLLCVNFFNFFFCIILFYFYFNFHYILVAHKNTKFNMFFPILLISYLFVSLCYFK